MLKCHNLEHQLSTMFKKYPGLAPSFQYQGSSNDHLFKVEYIHARDKESCEDCGEISESNLVSREARKDNSPVLHYGTID
jgi:hypothetical protein